jgi:hypothetical protein
MVCPYYFYAAIQQTKEMGCFVAGTLVHTQDGLKPIEQIQVGDLVLSRHESGEGELCYQPVTRTFEYEDREIYYVRWQVLDKETLDPKQIRGEMAVTGAHPIWVKRVVEERCDAESDGLEEIPHEINRWMSIDEIYLWHWKVNWDFEWNRGLGGGGNLLCRAGRWARPARVHSTHLAKRRSRCRGGLLRLHRMAKRVRYDGAPG